MLSNKIDIECTHASFRTIRGGTAVGIICDEVAYWRDASSGSVNPAEAILAGARPMLATTGGMLCAISSPYSRKGALWEAFKRDYLPLGDKLILVAKRRAGSNPTLPQRVVDRAYERDPAAADAEYGANFRTDLESFVSKEALEAASPERLWASIVCAAVCRKPCRVNSPGLEPRHRQVAASNDAAGARKAQQSRKGGATEFALPQMRHEGATKPSRKAS